MRAVDGDVVLSFIGEVDKAIDDAGVGQYKAFKLISGLKAIGIVLKREVPPAEVQRPNGAAAAEADAG